MTLDEIMKNHKPGDVTVEVKDCVGHWQQFTPYLPVGETWEGKNSEGLYTRKYGWDIARLIQPAKTVYQWAFETPNKEWKTLERWLTKQDGEEYFRLLKIDNYRCIEATALEVPDE